MPRQIRRPSKSKVYHIMIRGNEKKKIFQDDDDRTKFIDILWNKQEEKNFVIYAYCLMENHVHLIIGEGDESVSKIMQRINTSYAYYFNKKYQRTGHLFQDRFKSQAIESDDYLLASIRYVHNNPVKAKIVTDPSSYKWSSYNLYINKDSPGNRKIAKDFILGMFSANRHNAIELFKSYTKQDNRDVFIDHEDIVEKEKIMLDEKGAKAFIEKYLKNSGEGDLTALLKNKNLRDELICELRSKTSLSVRQIAGILGVGRGVVQRVKGYRGSISNC
ncbi:MAG: transposase [Pelotomaculum sp.]|nr:transposase [Pelotomaculum sp.]